MKYSKNEVRRVVNKLLDSESYEDASWLIAEGLGRRSERVRNWKDSTTKMEFGDQQLIDLMDAVLDGVHVET